MDFGVKHQHLEGSQEGGITLWAGVFPNFTARREGVSLAHGVGLGGWWEWGEEEPGSSGQSEVGGGCNNDMMVNSCFVNQFKLAEDNPLRKAIFSWVPYNFQSPVNSQSLWRYVKTLCGALFAKNW